MTDMTLRERVARAIEPTLWAILDKPEDAAEFGHPAERRAYSLAKAERAIAAMREPTNAVTEAISHGIFDDLYTDGIWKNAIDAALSEGTSHE